ncbi:MAG: outer membrane beta-barrel protein [Saprospiraceae bacterium]
MYKLIITLTTIVVFQISLSAQDSKWEAFAGCGYSNINRYSKDIQALHIFPAGAPNFLLTFHGGVSYHFYENRIYKLNIGLGFFTRGSSDYWVEFDYNNNPLIIPHRIGYIRMPINFNYRLLREKNYFFSIGITPAYLVWNEFPKHIFNSPSGKDPVFSSAIPFQLEYEIGFAFPILKFKHFSGKFNYTRAITSLDTKGVDNVLSTKNDKFITANYNLSFDLTIFYKF